uniref:Globin family profile domain-containing protein n=1 Tax=Acrobeloides nanus TaxID=290746 RepID=A0A914CMF8_9BILA
MTTPSEVKYICKRSLESAKIGTDEAAAKQTGLDFYKYLFANYPELRVYFKGAENFSANEIQQSDRFQHQGQQILLDCNTLANTFDDQIKFKTHARETVHRHMTNVDPSLWSVFFTVFIGFLGTKMTMDGATKHAWTTIGKVFAEECNRYLKDLGLPTS